ncbi:MAG: alpha/beta hydrolase [Roseiarcus sp.]|jgi:pimeloyl-ACP methyl ester carboxylesterase
MGDPQHGFEAFPIDANGFRFDSIARGDPTAPLVLFLHGWPSFATSWRDVMAPAAAAGFRAVAVDQRGYSRGARPGEVADYSVDHLIADIDGFARALAGNARFHLVGHDWGGLLAWSYAAHHTDRLASLTVLSTPHSLAFLEAMRGDPRQPVMSAYIGVFRQPGHVAEQALLRDGARKLRAIYGGKVAPAAIEENIARLSEPGALTATLNWYRALDNKRLGAPVATPTLYIWGSEDQALGAAAARATGRYVTGPYQFAPLEGASHWLPEEAPEIVARLLLGHLAKFPA